MYTMVYIGYIAYIPSIHCSGLTYGDDHMSPQGQWQHKEFSLQTQVFFWNLSFLFSPLPLSFLHFLIVAATEAKQKLLLAIKGSFSRGDAAVFPRLMSQLVWLSGKAPCSVSEGDSEGVQ